MRFLAAAAVSAALCRAGAPFRARTLVVKNGATPAAVTISGLKTGAVYSFLLDVDSGAGRVELVQGSRVILAKTLDGQDRDFYATFHALQPGTAQLRFEHPAGKYRLRVNELPASQAIEQEPNNRWQDANPISLGGTVFGTSDEHYYFPSTDEDDVDWYRFEFREARPKLVFFQIDLMERDNLPVDVSVYRVADGKAVAFNDGEDPVTLPHEAQALPGNKFTTRILKEPGAYYIRVRANHPEYKLRTRVYDPPPYADPAQAVRTAADYILGAGDSWHANTPRRGGVFDRVSNVHQETSLCVACHPTHFSLRAQLYAARNGYPVVQRQAAQFLTERFYNNPRPFYGFEKEGAVWARVISAPANVLSRMATLLDLYETQISGAPRPGYQRGVAEYLKLYYKDLGKLPPDETNGNTPLVSTYEVAWYSWRVTRDAGIARLIEQDAIKNMVDLCYQTLALADIDRAKYADKIRRNAERILSLQRPDGQWSMRFEASQPEVEFQTGHALWALHDAGVPAGDPRVAKAIAYLLKRQQPFGGWMDPLQSFENFRTPFRETQMAVLALSAYFPRERKKGWNAPVVEKLSDDPARLLDQLDNLWDKPSKKVVAQLLAAARSNETLIRQQAIEALGRVAPEAYAAELQAGLGDGSKLVQRTAAWAARQIYNRSETAPARPVLEALASADARVRWGATRIFATHFASLARRPEFLEPLAKCAAGDEPAIRMQALKGLWQYWFWTPDEQAKGRIEDAFLAGMAAPAHPWVERNLREGIYNIADENIRYLYNNWVPLLAKPEDRDRAVEGRLAVEDQMARKFARVLETGSDAQRKMLLAGLTEFPLRRGDIYDPAADHARLAPPVYNRIGNDIEQIVFFGLSNDRLARALVPLLDSPDAELRRLAAQAALLVREVKFAAPNQKAGPAGEGRALVTQALLRQPQPPEILAVFGHGPASPGARPGASRRSTTRYGKPDEAYFRGYVEPILETRGKDGYACVHCHATHTLFNGTYSTVMNVVDLNDPENSLILRKPTSSSESEGTLNSKQLAHGGGVRWEKDSPEYRTILTWIKGAR